MNIIISCVIRGDVDMWNWTIDNELISTGVKNYNLLSNTSLEIKNFSRYHQGIYCCIAANSVEVKRTYKTIYYHEPGNVHACIITACMYGQIIIFHYDD